jgi:NDP-sugar pyrophosphorylase family protein
MLPVAILAGGLATRLRPLTDKVPKSLLPVAGRPFIFHQLDLLKSQGIERIVLCLGHFGDQVQAAVGDGRCAGLRIQYSFDGAEPRGTGGALLQALPLLGEEFFVLNGDSYLRCPLDRIHSAFAAAKRPALMTVLRNHNRWDRSNVHFRDGVVVEYDKAAARSAMSHIDFGLSVFSRDAFVACGGSGTVDLAEVCRDLAQRGQLAAFEVDERFYEIGSPQGIRDTEEFLSRRRALA